MGSTTLAGSVASMALSTSANRVVRPRAAWPFVVWTLVLWVSRIRNVLRDDDLDGFGTAWRLGAALIFIALAAAGGYWAAGGRRLGASLPIVVLSLWTFGYWLIRGGGILIDGNHDLGFKAIHTILWAVSWGLGAMAWRRASTAP